MHPSGVSPPNKLSTSWKEHVESNKDKWLMENISVATNLSSFAESFKHGNVIAVSDGSEKCRKGAAAAVLHCKTTGQRIKASSMVPGNKQDQTSHRSELVGILLIVKIVAMLHTECDLSGSSITFGLDNDEARKAVMAVDHPSVKKPDYDLIYDIRQRMAALPITFLSRWIEGHQDDKNKDYDSMDLWTLLNIEMDIDAGIHREAHAHEPTENIPFPNEKVTIWIDDKKLAHFDKHELYTIVHGRAYNQPNDKRTWSCQQFWKSRENLSDTAISNIHWQALGKAFRKYSQGKQRWLVKHSTGQCGVGRMHLRRQYQDHSQCPRCGQPDETTQHVIQCHSNSATTEWNIRITALSQWLTKHHTNTFLHTAILQRLQEWRTSAPRRGISGPAAIRITIDHQDQIGWWPFLLGRVHQSFESCMDAHFQSNKFRNTGRPWLSNLITQLWDLQFLMWEHRNAIEHSDMTPAKQLQLDVLRTQAVEELGIGCATLLPTDKHLFEDGDRTSNLNLVEMKQWLLEVRQAREAANHVFTQRQRSAARARAFMRDWLSTAQAPPTTDGIPTEHFAAQYQDPTQTST